MWLLMPMQVRKRCGGSDLTGIFRADGKWVKVSVQGILPSLVVPVSRLVDNEKEIPR